MIAQQTPAGYQVTIPGQLQSYQLVIRGKLPGLNEYTAAQRTNQYKGAKMKADAQELVKWSIYSQMRGLHITKPVFLLFKFYEKDRRRDHDNVSSFAHKVIQDALVECGTLLDDGWSCVTGCLDSFDVDNAHPRIVVQFIEQEGKAECRKQPKKSCATLKR